MPFDQLFFSFVCYYLKAKVYSVDYKLAPEYKLPYAINENIAVCRSILDKYRGLENVTVFTDSAGGHSGINLLLDLGNETEPSHCPTPANLVCIYPWLSFRRHTKSWIPHGPKSVGAAFFTIQGCPNVTASREKSSYFWNLLRHDYNMQLQGEFLRETNRNNISFDGMTLSDEMTDFHNHMVNFVNHPKISLELVKEEMYKNMLKNLPETNLFFNTSEVDFMADCALEMHAKLVNLRAEVEGDQKIELNMSENCLHAWFNQAGADTEIHGVENGKYNLQFKKLIQDLESFL